MIAPALIEAAVDAVEFGRPTAVKRGRNPRWPYVPVLDHSDDRHQETEQLKGLAYETRYEAAQRAIEQRRHSLARKLADPRYRALREHHGLPREITP